MVNSYRINQIYSSLNKNNTLSIKELAESYNVTPTTIRRDLLCLEEQGLISRSRGFVHLKTPDPGPNSNIFAEEKVRIAEAAIKYVKPAMSIALDSGSTVYAICEKLITCFDTKKSYQPFASSQDINLVTNSLSVALRCSPYLNISMPGGSVNGDVMFGIDTERFYSEIRVDVAFLGTTGVLRSDGLTLPNLMMLPVKRNLASCAQKKIAVLDSSKFSRCGIYTFCNYRDLDVLITVETEENKPQLEEIAKQNVEIVTA